MGYLDETCVVCMGNPKNSALYFDNIVPLSFMMLYAPGNEKLSLVYEDQYYDTISVLSGLTEGGIDRFIGAFHGISNIVTEVHDTFDQFMELVQKEDDLSYLTKDKIRQIFGYKDADLVIGYFLSMEERFQRGEIQNLSTLDTLLMIAGLYYFDAHLKTINVRSFIEGLSAIIVKQRVNVILPPHAYKLSKPEESDITVSLTNVPLIDIDKIEIKHILEFRKDKTARNKLRNFHLFMHQNYEGKAREFIEDDLLKRYDEFKNACSNWGIETRDSVISAILDAKTLITTFAATAGGIFLDKPIAAGVAAITGASIEIGKIVLTLSKRKHAFHKLRRDHELAYIIEAKERLEKPSK